jgi:transcriptional regulator with XRE-family HTH domain
MKAMDIMTVEQFKAIRKSIGGRQKVAELLGCHPMHLAKVETGHARLSLDLQFKMTQLSNQQIP